MYKQVGNTINCIALYIQFKVLLVLSNRLTMGLNLVELKFFLNIFNVNETQYDLLNSIVKRI